MYNLIDEKLRNYYIKGHKYTFITCLCVSLILSVLSIFYTITLALLVIFVIITLIFFMTWNKNKKKYGKKLFYDNNNIIIYDYKNFKISEFKIEYLKTSYIKIAFDEYPRFNYKSCLVIYNNFKPYENMEYSSFWNKSNIAIIQNSELIDIINKILK